MSRNNTSRGITSLLLACALAAVLGGCAGGKTGLANMWKDPTFSGPALKNVMVVALRKDPLRRRVWEDAFVADLTRRGVTATPSYRLFPADAPDTQQAIDAVRDKGFDGVVVSVRLEPTTQERWVPGYVAREPYTVQNPWTGWYNTYYRDVHHPGYTETDKVRRFQTDVWLTGPNGRMIWSGTLETLETPNNQLAERAVTNYVTPELQKVGIVPPAAR